MAVQYDLSGFFYAANKIQIVKDLYAKGCYIELQLFIAAFGRTGAAKVVYVSPDGTTTHMAMPVGGVAPGHPLSCDAVSVSVQAVYEETLQEHLENTRLRLNVPNDSLLFQNVVRRFHDHTLHMMFVDDGTMVASPGVASSFLDLYARNLEVKQVALIAQSKTLASMLNRSEVAHKDRVGLTVALATIREKEAYAEKCEASAALHGPCNQNGVPRVVLPGIPLCAVVDYKPELRVPLDQEPDYTVKGTGGFVLLGAAHGTPGFMEFAASKKGEEIERTIAKVHQYPHYQSQALFYRMCVVQKLNPIRRNQGADSAYLDNVFSPVDGRLRAVYAGLLQQTSLDQADKILLQLPLRSSGSGIPLASRSADLAWLASVLMTVHFIPTSFTPTHMVSRALETICADPNSSDYARRLHDAVGSFHQLYCDAMGRPHDPVIDGFEMTVKGLALKRHKFMRWVAALNQKVELRKLPPMLTPAQKAGFEAQRFRGAAAVLTVIPITHRGTYVQNSEFMLILKQRFLKKKLGVAGGPKTCGLGRCTGNDDITHRQHCSYGNASTARHEALRNEVIDMLVETGVSVDKQDLSVHRGVLDRLAQAGAVNRNGALVVYDRGRGKQDGADTLTRDFFNQGEEVALDFTVVDERCDTNVQAQGATPGELLKEAEDEKPRIYQKMYEPIGIRVLGVAASISGGIGPNLRDVIRRCGELSDASIPIWANWSAGSTFFSAWRQRIILSIQVANATAVLRGFAASRAAHGVRRSGVDR